MKTIRTIALLAFSIFAVCGEAASGWSSVGAPSLGFAVADRRVVFNVNVTGLGDSPATLYLKSFASEGIGEYEWTVANLSDAGDTPTSFSYPITDGKATFHESFVSDEFSEINNLYLEIFVDANHYMLARLGEDPNLSITLNRLEYDPEFPDEPLYYYYDVSATVEFKDGYVAPFHEGPDPVSAPEPTSGLLLLVGLAAISLRRRA